MSSSHQAGPAYLARPYRLTVQQYDRMVEVGILGKRDRVELIEGVLVAREGRSHPHVQAGNMGLRALGRLLPPGYHAAKLDPLVLSDLSKPEPDLAVVRGAIEDYVERDVTAADVSLVAEIAEATLLADQREMKPRYAAGRIPIYWIINLIDDRLEVYSDPQGGDYRTAQVFSREQDVPLILDSVEVGRIRVADFLP
jgi:Uma2 family endonuclease